ncbi:uncharacterized protein FMAN_16170 [Fusarium mangiferae]|uniref:Uncharacterized protein n=1 Tax=Fusarium mangiferae TaxID=192010 RepID=A0A1L7TJL0_FUSMA|nr:uncharacterized protein FMAN_16170 [Fusarium mangiferae]CVK98774.1 uncharacterized protein FMAN_16170 [Fusarium mangiferae]
MQALQRTVAVIHTPYWNESEQKLPEDELQNPFAPTIIYFPRPDKKGHVSHNSLRRPKRDSQSKVHHSYNKQLSSHSEADRPDQSPESAFSSPSITCNFNMTDFERFLLRDTGKEPQQNKYSYYTVPPSTSNCNSSAKKRRRVDGLKMAEKEIREYERWVFGTWENIFSGSYSYSG